MTQKQLFEPEIAVEPPDGDKGREERGAHYTPDALAHAICRTLKAEGIFPRNAMLEPGCGGGAFLRAAADLWPFAVPGFHGVDLVPACKGPGLVEQRDLFTLQPYNDFGYTMVLGNPDFSIAERVVRHCMTLLGPGGHIAFLLLSSFEESKDRIAFWKDHPLFLRQAIGFPRPCFRADGATDMRPYALYVWRKDWRGPDYRGLRPLVWK